MAEASTSETALCNVALGHLGHDARLTSFDDEGMVANACRAAFWDAWLEELEAYHWNANKRRASLPALAAAPAFGFARQFQLPADCLRVREIWGATQADPWEVEIYYPSDDPAQAMRVIVTDIAAPLRTIYSADMRDLTRAGPGLRGAFALRLAIHLAGPITRSNTIQTAAITNYQKLSPDFKLMDALENGPEAPPDGTWVTDRAQAGGWGLSDIRSADYDS